MTQEKLKNTQLEQTEETILNSIDKRATPVSTENLLSRVNNSNSGDRTPEEENGFCENKPNSGAKLHQLLDANPRANAVAASWKPVFLHWFVDYVVLAYYYKSKITANSFLMDGSVDF